MGLGSGCEVSRIFESRHRIVDGAWSDHDKKAVVAVVQYFGARVAAMRHSRRDRFRDRQLLHQDGGRQQRPQALDS